MSGLLEYNNSVQYALSPENNFCLKHSVMLGVIFCVILGANESQFNKILFIQSIVTTQLLWKIMLSRIF